MKSPYVLILGVFLKYSLMNYFLQTNTPPPILSKKKQKIVNLYKCFNNPLTYIQSIQKIVKTITQQI